MDEPFGRQPKPVEVILKGEYADVHAWYYYLKAKAEYKGDDTNGYIGEFINDGYQRKFTIFPRAVND